jgi:hypothetical protein
MGLVPIGSESVLAPTPFRVIEFASSVIKTIVKLLIHATGFIFSL